MRRGAGCRGCLWDPSRCQRLSVIVRKTLSRSLGVYGRCDPCSEREPGLGRLRRTIPGRLCFRNGTLHSRPCAHSCKRPSGAPGGDLPEVLRPTKVQSGSAADWRPPKSGDQKGDGRPGYPMRSRRPSEMATDGSVVKRRFVELLDVTGSGVRAR